MRWWFAFLAAAFLLDATAAQAQRRRPGTPTQQRRTKRPAPKRALPAEIPIEVAVGPIGLVPSPSLTFEQPLFAGLQIDVAAVISRELIQQHKDKAPPWAQGLAGSVNEVKVRPWFLAIIPSVLVISPAFLTTGMYGAIWRPYGLGLQLLDAGFMQVRAGAAVDVAALFIHSSTLAGGSLADPSLTFFLRPGLNLTLKGEIPLGDTFMASLGWSSDLFIPQPYGKAPWELFPLEDSLWHLGGPFVMLHARIPYPLGG